MQFGNQTTYLFTVAIPAAAKYFAANWQNIIKAAWDYSVATLGQFGNWILNVFNSINWSGLWEGFKQSVQWVIDNTVNVFKSIPALVRGAASFAGIWKDQAKDAVNQAAKELAKMPDAVADAAKKMKEATDANPPFILPERQAGEMEKRLQDKYNRQGKALGEAYAEFRKRRLEEIGKGFGASRCRACPMR